RRWQAAPRDHLSDCLACECASKAHWLAFRKEDEKAIVAARPLLEGELSCRAEPHWALGAMLLPLIRLGRWEEARHRHLWGWRLICRSPHFIGTASDHLRYLVAAGDYRKALRVFQRFLPSALAAPTLDDRFSYYVAATLLLEAIAPRSRTRRILTLPRELPLW